MLDNILKALTTTLISIIVLSGAGFVLWWAVENIKRNCSKSECCKKDNRWECKHCGDILTSDTQPYCKTCSHIDRIDRKMDKLENK